MTMPLASGGSVDSALSLDGPPDADWPNRDAGRLVEAGAFRWHVQTDGDGPVALLLHGTGASTHSWEHLLPLLARRFRVVAPDLPRHGHTETRSYVRSTLPNLASEVGVLVSELGVEPDIVIGHSAGAAIGLRMALDGIIAPRAIVSVNGALLPFKGAAGFVFPSMARMLFLNPVSPRMFALMAQDRRRVARLVEGTGSPAEPRRVDLYQRLLTDPEHIAGTLAMMANWDLAPLLDDLAGLSAALLLLVGAEDQAVPPADAYEVCARLPSARIRKLKGLGHLAHEEAPEIVASEIVEFARAAHILGKTEN